MAEFVKVACVVVLMFAGTAAAVAWFDDRPSETTWLLRVGGGLLSIAALGVFLAIHFRRDHAPARPVSADGSAIRPNGCGSGSIGRIAGGRLYFPGGGCL